MRTHREPRNERARRRRVHGSRRREPPPRTASVSEALARRRLCIQETNETRAALQLKSAYNKGENVRKALTRALTRDRLSRRGLRGDVFARVVRDVHFAYSIERDGAANLGDGFVKLRVLSDERNFALGPLELAHHHLDEA